MMKTLLTVFLGSAVILTFGACKKVEGKGGSSAIEGNVIVRFLDGAENELTTYIGSKEDVYIIYGEEGTLQDDKVETSWDGSFRFDYLEPGHYQIFIYEEMPNTGPNGEKNVLIQDVEITDKKSTITLDTIYIKDYI